MLTNVNNYTEMFKDAVLDIFLDWSNKVHPRDMDVEQFQQFADEQESLINEEAGFAEPHEVVAILEWFAEQSEADADAGKVAKLIGLPTEKWKGQCYGVALLCIEKGAVVGKARYGHFLGKIHKDSMFAKNIGVGFCQHGWVELPDGRVWDPTRWVFENMEPYIYIGPSNEYDIGGNANREKFRMPAPKFDRNKKTLELSGLDDITLAIIKSLLEDDRAGCKFTMEQVAWVANSNPARFGIKAHTFYTELKRLKMDAFVPIDNWTLIME